MKNLGALNHAAALSCAVRRSKPAGDEIGRAECREQVCPPANVEVFSLDISFYRTADNPPTSAYTARRGPCRLAPGSHRLPAFANVL